MVRCELDTELAHASPSCGLAVKLHGEFEVRLKRGTLLGEGRLARWLTAHEGEIDGIIGQNDEMALGAIEAIKAAGLNVSDFAIAGIDGISDALVAVKAGEMASILQDGRAQAQGALDIAIFKAMDGNYEPMSDIWATYPDMPWNGGMDAVYNVPWTPVTLENVDALMAMRQ